MNIQKHNGHRSSKDDIAGNADSDHIPIAKPVYIENSIENNFSLKKTLIVNHTDVFSTKNLCEKLTPEPHDKYELLDTVGVGGVKVILRVRDKDTLRNVAMAVISEEKKSDSNINNFIKEARIAANLEHPNIIPVYDMGASDLGNPYFTMKLIRGESLSHILEKLSEGEPTYIATFTLPHLLQIFQKICDAIAFAHSKGVIHLDLSPANIQVGDFGEVLVLDWGLAKIFGKEEGERESEKEKDSESPQTKSGNIDETLEQTTGGVHSQTTEASSAANPLKNRGTLPFIESKLTVDGIAKGTPGYMAPEQAMGRNRERDSRTDIFALGAILYSLLTYQRAVDGTNTTQMMRNTVSGKFVPLYSSKPGCIIPNALKAVVMKAMSILPEERYQSVEELKKDIDAFIGGFATSAEKAGLLTRFWLFTKRHKRERAVALSLLFLFFAFFGFSQYYQHVQKLRDYRTLLSDSQRYEENKDYGSALDLLQKARMLYDKDEVKQKTVKLLIESARLLIDRENWAAAAAQLEKASALSADNQEIRRLTPLALGEGFLSVKSNIGGILKEHFVDENFQFIVDSRPPGNQLKVKVHGPVPIKELRMEDGFHYLYLETKFQEKIYLPTKIIRGQKTDINIPYYKIPEGFVYIHGGDFLYGDEKTITNGVVGKRKVYVSGFFMKKYPVSGKEYSEFLNSENYGSIMSQVLTESGLTVYDIDPKAKDVFDLKPMKYRTGSNRMQLVVGVSYYEALAYARWRGGRLPDEYEWEKAVRGIDGRIFSTGNLIPLSSPTFFDLPEKYLSPYGCRDLTGVLWQWTSTPDSSLPNRKIVKGGTAIGNIFNIQPSTRKDRDPKLKYINVGIIICKDL